MEQMFCRNDLRTFSDNKPLDTHNKLIKAYPGLYNDWQKRFPFDRKEPVGLELTAIFQESAQYIQGSEIFESFLIFCKRFWHLVIGRPAHVKQESLSEIISFHIHYYQMSELRIVGPHPKDMVSEVLSLNKLKNCIDNLISTGTVDNPILIHSSTGDDLYDHVYGAKWIGRTLPLDFSQLD